MTPKLDFYKITACVNHEGSTKSFDGSSHAFYKGSPVDAEEEALAYCFFNKLDNGSVFWKLSAYVEGGKFYVIGEYPNFEAALEVLGVFVEPLKSALNSLTEAGTYNGPKVWLSEIIEESSDEEKL